MGSSPTESPVLTTGSTTPVAGPRSFDVAPDWQFPGLLAPLVPPGGRVEVATEHIGYAVYDTAAGDLESAGARLTRPVGEGPWTLAAGGLLETAPATGRGIPAPLRDLLVGLRAGAPLRIVRRVRIERVVRRVRAASGAELGEIADVHEWISAPGPAAVVSDTRRVEIAGWDGPFVRAAGKVIAAGGGRRRTPAPGPAGPDTVGAALSAFVAEQRRAILAGDLELRRGGDAIHATRVAVRRLRSALRLVPITDPARRADLDAELAWFSAVLGEVRDRDVLRVHLAAGRAQLPPSADLDAAAALLEHALAVEHDAARAQLTAAMRGRRYVALLRALRDWDTVMIVDAAAARPVQRLARYVRAAGRRLDKKLARRGDSVEAMHRARKAAKRARYVAEFARPLTTKAAARDARALRKRAKVLQEQLGEHQDNVLAGEFIARVGRAADGAAAFGCGVLYAHEQRPAG